VKDLVSTCAVEVPIPHAGPLLPWDDFDALARRLEFAGYSRGKPEEQATMFLLDPIEDALELQAFPHPGAVYSR
jgi:uncharacterized protein